jgi:hypothetical protein
MQSFRVVAGVELSQSCLGEVLKFNIRYRRHIKTGVESQHECKQLDGKEISRILSCVPETTIETSAWNVVKDIAKRGDVPLYGDSKISLYFSGDGYIVGVYLGRVCIDDKQTDIESRYKSQIDKTTSELQRCRIISRDEHCKLWVFCE